MQRKESRVLTEIVEDLIVILGKIIIPIFVSFRIIRKREFEKRDYSLAGIYVMAFLLFIFVEFLSIWAFRFK